VKKVWSWGAAPLTIVSAFALVLIGTAGGAIAGGSR
jgi:hypothetical protein